MPMPGGLVRIGKPVQSLQWQDRSSSFDSSVINFYLKKKACRKEHKMASKKPSPQSKKETDLFLKIINYLGAALIFFGIVYFLSSNWNTLSDLHKLLSTLGVAILSYLIAAGLQWRKKYGNLSAAFFLITALVLPYGLYILLNVLNVTWTTDAIFCFITAVNLILFGYSYFYFRQQLLLTLSIIFTSLFFMSGVNFLASFTSIAFTNLIQYELMILGLGYIYFAYTIKSPAYAFLVSPLYSFGCLAILYGACLLGPDARDPYYIYWQIVPTVCIALAFWAAVKLQNNAFLILATIFFVFYMINISRYFNVVLGNYGWPLALILIGLAFLLAGYLFIYLRKKIR
jgi:hypothetical protein